MGQILIVEDNADIRAALLDALDGLGHTVTLAVNGAEGVRTLDALSRPCLVFLDMRMPELDGVGFLSQLARRADRNDFTVVVMSADPANMLRMKQFPRVVRFMPKPLDLYELLTLVEHHVS